MSISLNDHESRIKNLEQTGSGKLIQRMIFNGNSNASQITLDESIINFDAVVCHMYAREVMGQTIFVPKTLYNTNLAGQFVSGYTQTLFKIKDKTFFFIDNWDSNKSNKLKYVVGLKWGGGINLGTLLQRLLVYIKTYSKLFHLQFLEVK